MLMIVAVVALTLSVVSFGLFAYVSLSPPTPRGTTGLGTAELQAAKVDPSEFLKALATLTDSLAKAGPRIPFLVASFLFLIVSGIAAYFCCSKPPASAPPEKGLEKTSTAAAGFSVYHCRLSGFPDGEHGIPIRKASSSPDLRLIETPSQCLDGFVDALRRTPVAFVLLVGRHDRRELRAGPRDVYGGNPALAFQRALAARDYLVSLYAATAAAPGASLPLLPTDLAARVLPLAGGPASVGAGLDATRLAADRSVDLFAFWSYGPEREHKRLGS